MLWFKKIAANHGTKKIWEAAKTENPLTKFHSHLLVPIVTQTSQLPHPYQHWLISKKKDVHVNHGMLILLEAAKIESQLMKFLIHMLGLTVTQTNPEPHLFQLCEKHEVRNNVRNI